MQQVNRSRINSLAQAAKAWTIETPGTMDRRNPNGSAIPSSGFDWARRGRPCWWTNGPKELPDKPDTSLKQVQRTGCIHVEIVEGPASSQVMAWLRGGMNDGLGFYLLEQIKHTLPLAKVHLMVRETFTLPL